MVRQHAGNGLARTNLPLLPPAPFTKEDAMQVMHFRTETEYSFWGNVHYNSNDDAKRNRDEFTKTLKAEHPNRKIRKSMMRNQCHKYSGLGQPDGTVGHVYILRVDTL